MEFKYDVIVIGAGHAGCEAAAEDLSYHNGYEQNRTDEL